MCHQVKRNVKRRDEKGIFIWGSGIVCKYYEFSIEKKHEHLNILIVYFDQYFRCVCIKKANKN